MKKVLQTAVLIAYSVCVCGQVPQAFNYQAIVRNSDGTVKKNEPVSLQLSIVDEQGTSVYLESHSTSTNDLGLLQVVIGEGTSSNDMEAIEWESGPFFLDIEVDGVNLGTSPLLSVPYALYAESGNLNLTGDLILEGEEGQSDITISELFELLQGEGIVPNNYAGNVTDIDGDVYPTVEIGEQIWMAKNLKVSRFSDGTPISSAHILELCCQWTAYYTWYRLMGEMESSNENPSGVQSVCPDGWHLPSMAEWEELIDHLGGSELAGGKMKQVGVGCWNSPNSGASNESGLSALPAGWQDWEFERAILHSGEGAFFWTATEQNMDYAIILRLFHDSEKIRTEALFSSLGASVRCVKD
jgi:uncharacterized protein (TIGR02145 family)